MTLVYCETKSTFINDVFNQRASSAIETSLVREAGIRPSPSEIRSFDDTLKYMHDIMIHSAIPDDVWIAIELKIPQSSKRIDFIVSGKDEHDQLSVVIVELKGWQSAEITESDGMVKTILGGRKVETTHPSYQAWSYTTLIEDYNEDVRNKGVFLRPCASLRNYERDDVIENEFYKNYLDKAPVYLKGEAEKLKLFIEKHVKKSDHRESLYIIEGGHIKPSKALAECICGMLENKQEFILIDEQKSVYERSLSLAKESHAKNKNVLIVEGGPGTGKSVVAINLLAKLTNDGKLTKYITKNAAPREVFQIMLSGKFTKTRIASLFGGTGSFYDIDPNIFDVLIVDEGHRLNAKSGLYQNKGENQIKEIIRASKFSVFFLDEDQRVTIKDIGEKSHILKIAKSLGTHTETMVLESQFRCNGSNGYLSWLDNSLQIRETANETLEDIKYDFKIFDDPRVMHQELIDKNGNNKARMVAGYCWKWVSKRDKSKFDIVIGDYRARWNLTEHGQSWIIRPNSISEIGCIHTCQGLELEYIGVIIGPDLIVRNNQIITDGTKRATSDQSLKGFRRLLQESPKQANEIADMIIKNTYRTLMTRGMKGCYIFSEDAETREYFRGRISLNQDLNSDSSKIYSNVNTGAIFHSH